MGEYNELYHHGVKGQRWGIRRTPAQLGHFSRKRANKKAYPTNVLYRKKELTASTIKEFSKEYPQLRHVRINKNTRGTLFTDKSGKLSGMVNTEKKADGNTWIQALEVFGDNKGKGASYLLLEHAVMDMDATHLSVNKNNSIAKHTYDKYGFKTYSSDDTMYYMRVKPGTMAPMKWR